MNFQLKPVIAALAAFTLLSSTAAEQVPTAKASERPPVATTQTGVERMKAIMDSMQSGQPGGLSESTNRGVETGMESGAKSSRMELPASTVEFATKATEQWESMSKQAYVASLPARDRERGASLLLGDGTLPGHQGKLYFFVSRSMPAAMLRAYSRDALYTGATLVTRGVRKGDTIKEFVEEAMNDFTTVGGQVNVPMELNPNLFDMFQVTMVPAVVWTNRVGLEDIGAGCDNLPDGAPIPQIELEGPDDRPILLDKPTCAPASSSSFYKITGALTLPYVLDRFEEAGLAKAATKPYRTGLRELTANVHQGTTTGPAVGNAIQQLPSGSKLDRMPRAVLLDWQNSLSVSPVQRGPFGPSFSSEFDDEPDYREELEKTIRHGLGI